MIIIFILTGPIITEVMANVKGPESGPGDRNEFVEIYNNSNDTLDLDHWIFTDLDATDYIIPWTDTTILHKYPDVIINSTILYPGSYGLILDQEYTRPDTDQYQQPYQIPGKTLILTTDDTSIGNGLSTRDPILLFAPDSSCTTSFGTPFDTLDTIPFDPGDGVSLEIIDIGIGDKESNWHPSLDPSGSTPGKDNSTFHHFDLGVVDVILHPPVGTERTEIRVEVRVGNFGLQEISGWRLGVYHDRNRNQTLEEDERLTETTGAHIPSGEEETLTLSIGKFPLGEHLIGIETSAEDDLNPDNDTGFILLNVTAKVGFFSLAPRLYYPAKGKLQIEYQLPKPGGHLRISLYSGEGRKVEDLIDGEVNNTSGTIFWDGQGMGIGYYIVFFSYVLGDQTYQDRKTFVVAR
ncbi:MAG TPA: lamin tail domain-containing protein [bacterium (Candidatus Stahlbacteria)]|nr:lamin tail domain-containing protein [Candidatus Stahlbacteria bacterium]